MINPIKKRREEKRLTQADLALLVGVSQVYISQFETGGLNPPESQTKKITEILGISPETLNKELYMEILIAIGESIILWLILKTSPLPRRFSSVPASRVLTFDYYVNRLIPLK